MEPTALNDARNPPDISRMHRDRVRRLEAKDLWHQAGYSDDVIARLRWDARYSVIGIGLAEFAFSRYADYVAGLRAAWEARLVPRNGPSSILGIDLPKFAPFLRGVDVQLRTTGP
jgi:hypothetical protein